MQETAVRFAICDDDKTYAEKMKALILQTFHLPQPVECVIYLNQEQILKYYREDKIDIIFMDIQMQFMDGMAAAKRIRELDSEVIIMFITNMTNYAIMGYEVGALDYIVKPIDYFSFRKKIERAIEKVEKKKRPTITIRIKSEFIRLQTNDIYYIESDRHNLIHVTKKGVYISRASMQQAEERLVEYGFFRSNKSYLVNLQYIEAVKDGCCIINGTNLLISRARKSDFMVGYTTVGPHRDDISFYINEISARSFGSQGQQRSVALALKLAESKVMESITGDKPVMFLDDVMSELDENRQDYILNHLRDQQVFITCCDPNTIHQLKQGALFKIHQGELIEQMVLKS